MTSSKNELHHRKDVTQLGFWIFLMTDLMMFAAFFATYMVLRHGVNGGPGPADIVEPNFVLVQTVILLASSFTCGLAYVALRAKKSKQAITYLSVTIILGLAFLGMEIHEFGNLILNGHSWASSAFLSGFFGLVGLHGLHIFTGLIWAIILGDYISKKGSTEHLLRKFGLFAIFWHFLDIVWIFIFSIVYMMGVV